MILVSGASGFIGSAITRHLLAAGYEVRAMGRSAEHAQSVLGSLPEGRQALAEGRLTFVGADVTQPSTLPAAIQGVDTVVQAAQFPNAPIENPSRGWTYMKVDRDGTMNLLAAIALVFRAQTAGPGMTRFPDGAPRFLYVSGVTVSEDAEATWDRAKWQAEQAIRGSGLDWTIVRNSPSVGPRDVSFNRIVGFSDFLPFVPIFGGGNEKMSPVYVEDVGRLFARLVQEPEAARDTTLPFGGPDVVTMNQLIKLYLEIKRRRRPILHTPMALGKAAGAIAQLLPMERKPLSASAVEFASKGGVADLTLLRERFPDFGLTPIREALGQYVGAAAAAAPAARP
jgi:uncharacterized protein YbjT (DUF2867 family)